MKQVWTNLADKKYGGARGVQDNDIKDYLQKLQKTIDMSSIDTVKDDYLDTFTDWINSNRLNTIHINDEWLPVFANGTTDAFDKFYMKFKHKRFRVLPGEYFYHKITFTRLEFNWKEVLNPSDIEPGDAFIISLPFSDSGSEHFYMMDILNECLKKGVPVLLDCCYFGQCAEIDFPIEHPAVHTIAFSLSKCFDVPSLRAGIRYTRLDDDDPLFVYHKNNYINHYSAAIGTVLMLKFPSDYVYMKYAVQQSNICAVLDVNPSNCVNLATSNKQQYDYLNRGNAWNRLNIATEFTNSYPETLH
jgi:hypothetical protein